MGSEGEYKDYAKLKTNTTLAGLGQALVALSKENTQRLIRSATERQQERRDDAAAILARLAELNPAVASQFQPKQDALDSLTLRMILPSDVVPENSRVETPSYLIVSYCWHYPEWPLGPAAKPIAQGWEISAPMVDAIMDLRQSPTEGVWLDKLCINQDDDEEKQGHIASMDIIYQSARRLVILLEDIQLSEEETVAGLTYAKFYQNLCDEVKNRGLEGQEKSDFVDEYFPAREREFRAAGNSRLIDGIRDFALNILDGRWYTRAWCAHESRVTPHQKINNPLLLCFAHDGRVLKFEFRFVFYLSIYLHGQEEERSAEDQVEASLNFDDVLSNPSPKTLAEYRYRIQRLNAVSDPDASSMQHVAYILSFGCLNKGDLMSIALNTSGIPLSFTGKVSEADDVLWMFSLLALAAGDLVPLITTGNGRSRRLRITDPSNPDNKLISWVPVIYQGIVDEKTPLPSPEVITAVSGDYIELDLLLFRASPSNASPEALEVAAQIMEEHRLDELAEQIKAEADAGTRRNRDIISAAVRTVSRAGTRTTGPMAVFHKLWLAHALDCGLEWMLRFPEAMRRGTTDLSWNHGPLGASSDPRFTSAAESFLKHFLQKESSSSSQGDPPEAESTAQYLPGIIRALTTLFDPRLPFFTTAPRRLPLGNNDHAFVSSTSNITYIAVPVAVAHLPSHHPRAWNIEPFDPLTDQPENLPDDHLPDLSKVYPWDAKPEDVFPVMTSDYADRRRPYARDDARTCWRLRRRGEIFGFTGGRGWDAPVDPGMFPDDGEVIYLRRQRVYGADDYDWKAIGEAGQKLKMEPQPEAEAEPKSEIKVGTGAESTDTGK